MEQIISKEEFNELMQIKGQIRGVAFKTEAVFILKTEGEEGLKKIEDTITRLGYPMKYGRIRATGYYPLGLQAISLVIIKRLFNFNDKKFQEMGRVKSKTSPFVTRIFVKYLISLERLVKEVPRMWRKHFTVGNIDPCELNEEKKCVTLRLEDFRLHPIHCQILIGFFSEALQMVLKSKATCEEIKCVYRGDEYHEFLVKW
jgi:predicted hydrocarbon binding protein